MASLTIAGTALDCSEGGEGQPILIGESSRAYAGSLRNSERGQKRTFSVTTIPYVEATKDTVLAAIAQGAQVTCSGTALGGDSLTMQVRGSCKLDSTGRWVMSLAGEQV